MADLAKFHAWIWVGVGIGKFLIDLGVGNIRDTKITWSGSMLTSGWLGDWLFCCIICLTEWFSLFKSAHRKKQGLIAT